MQEGFPIYFYGLLFKIKGWECGGLIILESLIEEDDVLCRTPRVPVDISCRILNTTVLTFNCNILQKLS